MNTLATLTCSSEDARLICNAMRNAAHRYSGATLEVSFTSAAEQKTFSYDTADDLTENEIMIFVGLFWGAAEAIAF